MIYIQLLLSGILFGGIYALISVGLTLILGVMDIINLAHGEFLMISLYGVYFLSNLFQVNPYLSMIILVPLLFLVGIITERFIIRKTIGKPTFIHIFVTLGLSIIIQNLALTIFSANYRTIDFPFANKSILLGDISISVSRLIIFVITLIVAYLLYLFLNKLWFGFAIRATSQDRDAAQLMGIDINRVFMVTFGIGTACLGIAGALLMPIYYVYPQVGFDFVLVGSIAIVMGGLGSIKGAMIASIMMGVIEIFSGYYLNPSMKQGIYFMLFILVLIIKPNGLFGTERKVE